MPDSPLTFIQCKKVTVQNLTIDWRRPLHSVGRILGNGDRYFDVEVWDEFPVEGGEPVEAFMEYDPETLLPRRDGFEAYAGVSSTELLGPQVLRVHTERRMNVTPGVLVILRHRVYGPTALFLQGCSGVTVRNVTIHAIPGMGIIGSESEKILIERFRVVPPEGSRIMTATADATHFSQCRGFIRFNDCLFDGMGDDAINIHSLYLTAEERIDERTIMAAHGHGGMAPPHPGDRVEFAHRETLLPFAEGVVESVETDHEHKMHRVVFAEPLPTDFNDRDVFGNLSWIPKVHINNCIVRNNRARGFLIQTRDAVIENNQFLHCSGAGMHITADACYWHEAIGTRRITVRNNLFEGVGNGAASQEAALIVFAHVGEGWAEAHHAPAGVHRDITIEGNTFRDTDNAAIFVGSTDGCTIRGNTIENACRRPDRDTGKAAISIMNTRRLVIEGNTVAEGHATPLLLGDGCEADSTVVRDNTGF